jgi:hypothetical protein
MDISFTNISIPLWFQIKGKQRNVAEIMKELEDLQIKAGRDDQSSPDSRKSPKGM